MKTQKTDKKQISVKNLIVCLNTYKNSSNFFTNLSKTAKIYVKKFCFSKKVLYLCNVKIKKTKNPKKNKVMKTNLKDLRNSINGRCMSLINDGWYNCGDLLEHDLTNFINEKLFLYDIKDEFKIDYYFSLDDLEKLLIWAKNDIGIDYKIILDINNLLWNNNNVSNNNKKYINDFNIDIITTICNKFASTVIHMFYDYDYDYDTLSNDKLPVDWLHDLYMCLDKNELSKMIFDYPDFANKKYKKLKNKKPQKNKKYENTKKHPRS